MLVHVAIAAAAEDTAGRLLGESRGWKIFINFVSQALEICRKDPFERSIMKHVCLHILPSFQPPTLKCLGGSVTRTQHEFRALPWAASLVALLEHHLHGRE